MQLHIISPTSKKSIRVAWLEINTTQGNFVIQPGHAPCIMTLAHNERFTYCLTSGKRESVPVTHGIVEIDRTGVTILLDKES